MSFPDRQKTAVAAARAPMPTQPPCFMAKGMESNPMPMKILTWHTLCDQHTLDCDLDQDIQQMINASGTGVCTMLKVAWNTVAPSCGGGPQPGPDASSTTTMAPPDSLKQEE